jgi:hypothetical protein
MRNGVAPTVEKPDPDCSGSQERYLIVEKPDGIRPYDLKTKISTRDWFALKLIPAE